MLRRSATKLLVTCGISPWSTFVAGQVQPAVTVDNLPNLEGELTLYLGRGEGGLYENVLKAIGDRNPDFKLNIRRGPTAALANAIVAESRAGIYQADLFWAVDTGAIGLVAGQGLAHSLPADLVSQVRPEFQYKNWLPVTGRVRTIPFNNQNVTIDQITSDIMSLPETSLRIGWAPEYASFQSFITAMRILEGERATKDWLEKINRKAKKYAGELGVVMGVERGEVDIGFANHYYTLRLKSGKPDAQVDLAFTQGDAGCLVNASGILAINENETTVNFIRYLFTKEVQTYLSEEAFEIPLAYGVAAPPGLPSLEDLSPPELDLTKLADLRPTLDLMREIRVL
ncbi:MAG: extracellular solute-binding protein [Gammaproteobacteria bacterium]|nr:extracellular solute-binding protein [Gammaproteobacteria bacterium]